MTTMTHDTTRTAGLGFALASAASFGLSGSLARGLMDAGWSSAAAVSVRILLAAVVLAPLAVVQLRGRWDLLRRNLPLIEAWLTDAGGFSWIRPEAGAIIYVHYDHAINSTTLANRLREEKSVLVVPGDHFGMDGYLRVGFGSDPAHLVGSLDRIAAVVDSLG